MEKSAEACCLKLLGLLNFVVEMTLYCNQNKNYIGLN